MMQSVQLKGPGEAALARAETPEPSGGEVLLEILRVGLCGSDLNSYRGMNPLVTYPRVPGHEIAARILERGPDTPESFAVGAIVTALPYTACGQCSACLARRPNACRYNQTLGVQRDGALAERIVLPWEKLIEAPRLRERDLALVEPLSVGFHAAERGRIAADDTVLVFGCGMIGLGVIAAAGLDRQARVLAVDIDDQKLELARACGASHVLNSSAPDFEKTLEDLTEGNGPQVVVEAVGLPETFQAAVKLAGFAGRIVYIGYAKAPVSYETKLFVMKELDILGSRNATRADFDRVISLLESGRFPAEKCVTGEFAWTEAPGVFQRWSGNPAEHTKIHLVF